MAYIAVPLPNLPGKHDIEIDVTINGQKQQLHYRVELPTGKIAAYPASIGPTASATCSMTTIKTGHGTTSARPPKSLSRLLLGKRAIAFCKTGSEWGETKKLPACPTSARRATFLPEPLPIRGAGSQPCGEWSIFLFAAHQCTARGHLRPAKHSLPASPAVLCRSTRRASLWH